jgi:toxoflavin synthase
MARMAVYHRHCQDPVVFQALGDVRGKSLLDLACGDGFYTRRFRGECGSNPVTGVGLSAMQIQRAQTIEQQKPGYRVQSRRCDGSRVGL